MFSWCRRKRHRDKLNPYHPLRGEEWRLGWALEPVPTLSGGSHVPGDLKFLSRVCKVHGGLEQSVSGQYGQGQGFGGGEYSRREEEE